MPHVAAEAAPVDPAGGVQMTAGSQRDPRRSSALPRDARRALGGLVAVIEDPEVNDILIQVDEGVGRLWVDRHGRLTEVSGWEVPAESVRGLAVALIASGGRHVDELQPFADVHLGGGVRVHAVLPPAAPNGEAVSIRLPSATPLSFNELVEGGLCDWRGAELLRAAVDERQNLLISGGTATGKTTLLAALLDLVPSTERIITIEDVAEIRLQRHRHRVALEARQANADGVGEIELETLLRQSLRMRPDRIVLGECRGAELAVMLTALNTGHDGGAATVHASGLAAVPDRLTALGALAGIAPNALARQAATAIHVVVHLERSAGGQRRIAGIGRLRRPGKSLEIERIW